jgi:hypothetical protein
METSLIETIWTHTHSDSLVVFSSIKKRILLVSLHKSSKSWIWSKTENRFRPSKLVVEHIRWNPNILPNFIPVQLNYTPHMFVSPATTDTLWPALTEWPGTLLLPTLFPFCFQHQEDTQTCFAMLESDYKNDLASIEKYMFMVHKNTCIQVYITCN